MNNLCIIPARGGSKRIPRKNIKPFLGVPIIKYSIKAALESNLFNDVIVSTDDQEIAELAESFGASVPYFRSKKNSNDHATTASVMEEVLSYFSKDNLRPEHICCLYPIAPFVTSQKLTYAYNVFLEKNKDCLIPVTRYSHPPQRGFKATADSLSLVSPEYRNKRTQDIEPIFHDSGQFYWLKTSSFQPENGIFNESLDLGYIIVSPLEEQDIDNESDWELAEMKYKVLRERGLI